MTPVRLTIGNNSILIPVLNYNNKNNKNNNNNYNNNNNDDDTGNDMCHACIYAVCCRVLKMKILYKYNEKTCRRFKGGVGQHWFITLTAEQWCTGNMVQFSRKWIWWTEECERTWQSGTFQWGDIFLEGLHTHQLLRRWHGGWRLQISFNIFYMLLHINLLFYLFHSIQLEWHCIA